MEERRCRRHPPVPGGGVCPHCLRDRLLRLCPECACARPCACSCASSPSSSSSSGAGAVGRVHSLIERERRVARSRSVAAHAPAGGDVRGPPRSGVWGWVSFRKQPPPPPDAAAGCKDVEQEYDDAVALARSRSVSTAAAAAGEEEPKEPAPKAGGWGRFIPGKIKALRSRKSRAGGDWRDSVR
ncbi:unnamed protein product [Urochloa humidicola]